MHADPSGPRSVAPHRQSSLGQALTSQLPASDGAAAPPLARWTQPNSNVSDVLSLACPNCGAVRTNVSCQLDTETGHQTDGPTRLVDIDVPEGIKANNIDDVGKGLLQLAQHPAVGDRLRRILEEWGTQVHNFVDTIAVHLGNREAGGDGVIPATGVAPPAPATSGGPSDLRSVAPHPQSSLGRAPTP